MSSFEIILGEIYKYIGNDNPVSMVPSPTYPVNIRTSSHIPIYIRIVYGGKLNPINTPIKVPAPLPPLKL